MIMKRASFLVIAPLALVLAACATQGPPQREKAYSSVAFSPDHSLLAFADAAEIRVLEVETRALVNTLRQLPQSTKDADPVDYRHGVGDTMVFLDNDRIATTGMGGLVSIWDIRGGNRLSVIDRPSAEVFASTLDFFAAANRLIIGTGDGELLLTHLGGDVAGPLLPVAQLGGYVWDLQFGPDGRYFASASMPARPEIVAAADPAGNSPAAGQISEGLGAEGPQQFSEPVDSSNVAIWDAESLETVGKLEGAREVYKMALVPGEKTLLTAGDEILMWEFLTLAQAGEVTDPSMVLQGIGVGTMVTVTVLGLAAGAALGAPLMIFDPLTTAQILVMPAALTVRTEACFRSVAVSPDGQTIVSTTRGPSHNVMAVIDRPSNKVVDKWKADFYVCDMDFSPDGRYLLTATTTGIQIYDTVDWKRTNIQDIGAE
jgi:WD40 repeat protein